MSSETYKAILKIAGIVISGAIFSKDDSIDKYLPLYDSLIEYLDVMDIVTHKLYLQDNKITFNSIKLVTDLINRALKFGYSGIITLAARLKHVTFFSTIGNLIETDDKAILDATENLKVAYYNLNEYLDKTHFDLSVKAHQVMLNNLFIYLEVSLNEYGTPATTEEYVKAGFTDNPRTFVIENFTMLLAMDLKIFLKDHNFTFKKRFHEELMMSNHSRTFPLYLFMDKCTNMWVDIFHRRKEYPFICSSVLSWELMIYYTMNNCLVLWQETRAQLENEVDVDRILQLLLSNVESLELEMSKRSKSIEECLDITASKTGEEMRRVQVLKIKDDQLNRWKPAFTEFNKVLAREVIDFVSEQRVIQLLKGSWYYFLTLSPNRKSVYYREFVEKPSTNPSYEEMEKQFIRLTDITDFRSTKIGEHIGEEDKRNNSMLISIKGTISYERITLLGENNKKLLSFYTDTEVNKYVWLDGLKMLKGMINPGQLSDDTQRQIENLIDIRRNTQLLALENKTIKVEPVDDDDDEFYDMAELTAATNNFYYK
ncbi:uncharacterized protein RJT20DRAFT_147973 [Scheffersomyces xylosifermentans]|uniref:uncharacterized protein n=1 Tax=Scheffersomyces xylosifermentans TaxID=1304137 RepID=UPI00315C6754